MIEPYSACVGRFLQVTSLCGWFNSMRFTANWVRPCSRLGRQDKSTIAEGRLSGCLHIQDLSLAERALSLQCGQELGLADEERLYLLSVAPTCRKCGDMGSEILVEEPC
jgi:hypothetical protein